MARKGAFFWLPLIATAVLFTGVGLAHEDTILEWKDDDELIGLPERYSPAYLQIGPPSNSHDVPVPSVSLSISNRTLDFPVCVEKYFPVNQSLYKLRIASSWYHVRSKLPPYLHMSIDINEVDYGYSLLFNMDTLEPIKFIIGVDTVDGDGTSLHSLEIGENYLKEIRSSIVSN